MSPGALVTGGATRVGRAIVEELLARGFRVAFTFNTSVLAAQELAEAYPDRAFPLRCNLADSAATRKLVPTALSKLGNLQALVNNAAVFPRTPLEQLSLPQLREVLAVNLEAPLFLSRDAAPHLAKAQGAIVNLTDIYGQIPLRGYTAYVLSKAALAALTRQLAAELAPHVRVNAIAPGIAAFPEEYDEATRERLLAQTLLHRAGSPKEIARAVCFLLESPTVTGHLLVIDAGRSLGVSQSS